MSRLVARSWFLLEGQRLPSLRKGRQAVGPVGCMLLPSAATWR